MPKLIIKQENQLSWRERYASRLSVAGLLLLLMTVAAAGYYYTHVPVSRMPAVSLATAANPQAVTEYQVLNGLLQELSREYEELSATGAEDYRKNLYLSGKAEAILRHLDKMDEAVLAMGLSAEEQRQALNQDDYNKDYWQAKLYFRQLRQNRYQIVDLEQQATPQPLSGVAADSTTLPIPTPGQLADTETRPRFAEPPPGMKLPEGFCTLSGPNACKPDSVTAGVGLAKTIREGVAPEEADGSGVVLGLADSKPLDKGGVPLPAPAAPEGGGRRFQFAAPPPGMALPEGFCTLSGPNACKPDGSEGGQ